LRNGRSFHKCFCGSAGFIGGTIKKLESKRLSIDGESDSSTAGRAQQSLAKSENFIPSPKSSTTAALGSNSEGNNVKRTLAKPVDPALPSPSNSSVKR
jgi:hypothetical protein